MFFWRIKHNTGCNTKGWLFASKIMSSKSRKNGRFYHDLLGRFNNILWRSFYTKHVCWHVLTTLTVGVTTHLCSQQEPIFSARAHLNHLFFLHQFYSSFKKPNKYKLQCILHEFKVFSIQLKMRVICW
jgi:hypothetical protein